MRMKTITAGNGNGQCSKQNWNLDSENCLGTTISDTEVIGDKPEYASKSGAQKFLNHVETPLLLICGCGGIGRRVRLRIWSSGMGSSPFSRTFI